MKILDENKKLITIILITAIIFARSVVGIVLGLGTVATNVVIDGLAFLYCVYLILQNKNEGKKALINFPVIWLVVVMAMVFIYGYFRIGTCADYFSRQYLLLTLVPPVFILIMLLMQQEDIIDILVKVGTILIPIVFVVALFYDRYFKLWLQGYFVRAGCLPAGTVVDTGNLYVSLLIPMFYSFIVLKNRDKLMIASTIIGLVGVAFGGSKSSMFPLVLAVVIMVIGAAKDKKVLIRSLIVLVIVGIIGIILLMCVPFFYDIFGYRLVEFFTQMNATEYDLHTSTGQRMAFTAAFKEHFWEAPLFGHGFYAFKEMPYSALEEYVEDGQTLYRNIQLHMNFLEILFSYGIFGFIIYYVFPVKLIIDAFLSKNKQVIILAMSFICAVLFMDLGLDMYYKYLTSYYIYFVIYVLIKKLPSGTSNHTLM